MCTQIFLYKPRRQLILCFSAVSCMRYHNIGPPTLLRTYRVRANQDDNCKIWEAIRATTASILLFEPIEIGPSYSPQIFVDAELVANNPVTLVYREKEGFYLRVGNKPPPEIGCVVSIGCGSEYPISLKTDDGDDEAKGYWERFKGFFGRNVKEERAKQLYDVMLRIAKDCERQHQQISASYHEDEERIYFRLNVKSGLEAVAATDWTEEERAKIMTQSETYESPIILSDY
jgi:predicted acylesterase/phospholipase RssA